MIFGDKGVSALLTKFNLGPIELKNRVVMAAMTRSRTINDDLAPTDMTVEYYRQRATAGLSVSEGVFISPKAIGYVHVPGIWTQAQIEGWKRVTDAVHHRGGVIFVQLWHVGALSHPDLLGGELPAAPSAVNPEDKVFTKQGFTPTLTPREMTLDEIAATIDEYRVAARNAVLAGFDGIEILASHGYLIAQFWSRSMNKRTDAYGGTLEKRARFVFDVIDAISKEISLDRVGIKINPSVHGYAGIKVDEETLPLYEYMVNKLNDLQLAYVHIMEPTNPTAGLAFQLDGSVTEHFRKTFRGTIITNTDYSVNAGDLAIRGGVADLVGYARAFISNPDLVERIRDKQKLSDADVTTFYAGGAAGYIDYPTAENGAEGTIDFDTSVGVPFKDSWGERAATKPQTVG